jgi:FlaA1/EpsC-like NDP-sugar epimerase
LPIAHTKLKFLCDLLFLTAVTPLAFWLRLDDQLGRYTTQMWIFTAAMLPLKAGVIYWFGLYRQCWRKIGVRDLVKLIQAILFTTAVLFTAAIIMQKSGLVVPRSVPLIEAMAALLVMSGIRLSSRILHEYRGKWGLEGEAKRVLIVGAGEAGTMVAREMIRHPEAGLRPVGFLDDEPNKRKQTFLGLPVLGGIDDLIDACAGEEVDEVIIAIPSAPGNVVRRVVELAGEAGVKNRIIPAIYDLLSGKFSISQIRDVDVEDLLGREAVNLNVAEISEYVKGRTVLVTGAGGSIGSEIVRTVADFSPKEVILLGRGENSLYHIEQEVRRVWPHVRHHLVVADVRDHVKMKHVFEHYQPEVVFHAAAHKHVPMMEANPDEAVLNNIGGTKNLVELALAHQVRRFVNISTDKAVNPTSVMGATKRVAEQLVSWAAAQAKPGQVFVSVRFGNVLGSRGSVIPLFKEQILRGGPVTVTHAEMTRYFMTIPEACQLVLQAGGLGENGSVYILDMGEPVKIVDLAVDLIRLSGLRPHQDIEIVFSGMRQGEKLFEELLTAEEGTQASRHQRIFTARKSGLPADFAQSLDTLFEAAERRDASRIRNMLKYVIPTYQGAATPAQPHPAA